MTKHSFIMFCFLASLLCSAASAASSSSFSAADSYLVKCGESQTNLSIDGRIWLGDASTLTSSFSLSSSATTFAASISDSPIPLLNTSRIFTQTSTYSFPITPGRHWLRLYFHAFSYLNFTSSAAAFSVSAARYTLLYRFSPASSAASSSPNAIGDYSGFFFKEYNINFTESPALLTFTPISASSYAFVNAIELISAPPDLVSDDTSPLGINSPTPIGIPSRAMETLYRINVGGPLVVPLNDTAGLYRTWSPHQASLLSAAAAAAPINASSSVIVYQQAGSTPIIAPSVVYSTALQIQNPQGTNTVGFNLSWIFPIAAAAASANNSYVVRFHLCELQYSTGGKRYFNLYVENQTAFSQLDLAQDYGQYSAVHIDVSVTASESNLWVQAGPAPNVGSSVFSEAIMNGIEVWKLSDSQDSLDGGAAAAEGGGTESSSKKKRMSAVAAMVGGALGAAAAVALVVAAAICCCCRQRAKVVKQPAATPTWVPLSVHGGHSAAAAAGASKTTVAGSYASSSSAAAGGGGGGGGASNRGRVFAFGEILEATRNFEEALVIGVGGFGKVYRGTLAEDGTKVAVKRGNPRSEQGLTEFQTEIDMLSKLRHRHLVSLIGYCKEKEEMILVYEFMANGPLRSHLYGTSNPPLSWKQRLEICVGAARGLHYLHTGATQSIIHRDVKTTNILLDDNLVAKVSDFGLSKTGPSLDQTHVSTAVKGSFGYLDPEYFRRQQLTEKSDVYSLGVVLMEVICARPAINPSLPRDQVNIAEWAMHWQTKGLLHEIMDPYLVGGCGVVVDPDSLAIFGKTAEKCLAEEGLNRPAMGQVLWNLEYALQLQDRATTIPPPPPRRADTTNNNKVMAAAAAAVATADDEAEHLPMLFPPPPPPLTSVSVPVQENADLTHRHSFFLGDGPEDEADEEEEEENITMSAVFSQMVRPSSNEK